MTYEELRSTAKEAVKQVARMGTWDGVSVDVQNGEPVVLATLRRTPVQVLLAKLGVGRLPTLPERIAGIRCKVLVRTPPTKKRST